MVKDRSNELPPIDWGTFGGLRQPHSTQVPDDLFDWVMPYLSGAELKVLLYIVLRTFGFKKESDAISLDQLCNGIVRRDGRRLDLGTGLKRPTVLEALRSLREKNLIITHQQVDTETGTRPTVYALHLHSPEDRHDSRGGMLWHTPGYVARSSLPVDRVCSSIRGESARAYPQETVTTRNSLQGDSIGAIEQRESGWTVGESVVALPVTEFMCLADAQELWSAVLADLQLQMTTENFTTWLATTAVVRVEGNCLSVAARSQFQCNWLEHKLRRRIEEGLRRQCAINIGVKFVSA